MKVDSICTAGYAELHLSFVHVVEAFVDQCRRRRSGSACIRNHDSEIMAFAGRNGRKSPCRLGLTTAAKSIQYGPLARRRLRGTWQATLDGHATPGIQGEWSWRTMDDLLGGPMTMLYEPTSLFDLPALDGCGAAGAMTLDCAWPGALSPLLRSSPTMWEEEEDEDDEDDDDDPLDDDDDVEFDDDDDDDDDAADEEEFDFDDDDEDDEEEDLEP
jgi:hypothetical protein